MFELMVPVILFMCVLDICSVLVPCASHLLEWPSIAKVLQ